MIDGFVVACYVIIIVSALYGLFFGLIKVLTPIASGLLSIIAMLTLRKWAFGFLFKWSVMQNEGILSRIVAILIVFIGGSLLFRCAIKALDLISKLPLLNGMNKLLGCMAGLFEGVMLVWLFMYFVHQFQEVPLFAACVQQIHSAPILVCLYEKNLVLYLFNLFINI